MNENYLSELRKENNILFIVGTLNPHLEDVEFFSIEDMILGMNISKFSRIGLFLMAKRGRRCFKTKDNAML
ncbi:hypothetical protein EfmJHP36_05760 [Enterococcus faecium]|nr:hypothetical protein EfmJHP36_05760 [Enterococcus faecium]